jgi:sec-independent protein translocase protein TatC
LRASRCPFPVIAHQLWRFVAPGLYRSEKGAILPFLVASPILFTMGAAFAHYVVTPLAMNFFIGFADAIPILTNLYRGGDEPPAIPMQPTTSCARCSSARSASHSTWR